ncbi:hypothetical protein [Acinetobacter baumannii]|nr:hypothetical protein [Acinetobacter baumannii]
MQRQTLCILLQKRRCISLLYMLEVIALSTTGVVAAWWQCRR